MEHKDLAWSGQSWRLPPWLWLSVAAMAVSTLHILLDFGIGLFPLQGRVDPAVGATLLLVSLIHVWWCVSLAAGTHGNGGGVASAAILGFGWTLLTNDSSIQFCLPPCRFAAPLSDIAHVGSLVLGIVAPGLQREFTDSLPEHLVPYWTGFMVAQTIGMPDNPRYLANQVQ